MINNNINEFHDTSFTSKNHTGTAKIIQNVYRYFLLQEASAN